MERQKNEKMKAKEINGRKKKKFCKNISGKRKNEKEKERLEFNYE